MKKILYSIISLALILSLLFSAVTAFAVSESSAALQPGSGFERLPDSPGDNEASTFTTGLIADGKIRIVIEEGNIFDIVGFVKCTPEVVKCGFSKIIVEQRKNSSSAWETYCTFDDYCAEGSSYTLNMRYAVMFNYQYRIRCTCYARKNLLSNEKLEIVSNVVTILA